jgi:hemoglobin
MANEPILEIRVDKNSNTSLYEYVGGEATCRRLSKIFHDRVAQDTLLKDLFPKNLERLTEHFALFIAERLGGPRQYTATRGKQSLVCRHAYLPLGSQHADRWLEHMYATLDEVGVTDPARQRLRDYFTETARTLSNPFLPYYNLSLVELQAHLERDPALATASDHGRTLLREASRTWDLPRVQMLLNFHADVTSKDLLGHDALYHAVTASAPRSETEGRDVVELLIKHGANVNGQSGPGKSTPLHMAARRGHVIIGECLLAAGANIEMRDSKGETPLRRAVNCGQIGMVRLLMAHGANAYSRDRKGQTVLSSARREDIKEVLCGATA